MAAGNRGVEAEAIVAERPVVDGLVGLAEERGMPTCSPSATAETPRSPAR